MFQTKSFTSILASMVNRLRATSRYMTDFSIGATNRVMVEAVAQEQDELYQQMVAGLVEAIPVSVYRTFNFALLGATYASAPVRVFLQPNQAALTVLAGTVLTTPATTMTYAVLVDTVIPVGAPSVDLPVIAASPGSAGNLIAGSAFALAAAPPGFQSATNLAAIANGSDAETEDERKLRFNDFITTIARGTLAACSYAARRLSYLTDANGYATERVVHASLYEPWKHDPTQPVGLFNLYVHNGVGNTSSALVSLVAQNIYGYYKPDGTAVPGYKPAGVKATIAAALEYPVVITGTVTTVAGADHPTALAAIQAAVAGYILALPIGATVIMAEVTALAMAVAGVDNFVLAPGSADLPTDYRTKPMPGALAFA